MRATPLQSTGQEKALARDGFTLLREAFSSVECEAFLDQGAAACVHGDDGLMRSATGAVYGARNIRDRWPGVPRPDGYRWHTFVSPLESA